MEKKLRKGKDKQVSGVCSGVAEYFGLDVTFVRIIALFLLFFTEGVPMLTMYVIGAIVMPDYVEPEVDKEVKDESDEKKEP